MLWWSDSLKTGIESIDNQHKAMFNKADEIFNLGADVDKDEFKKVISFLMSYTNNHFSEEEELMVTYRYENLIEHRREHNYFVEEIYKLYIESFKGISLELLIELKILIIEWLANHINVDDKKFIEVIKERDYL